MNCAAAHDLGEKNNEKISFGNHSNTNRHNRRTRISCRRYCGISHKNRHRTDCLIRRRRMDCHCPGAGRYEYKRRLFPKILLCRAVICSRKKRCSEYKKHTEYSRVILALTSIGKDAQNICGYDLTAPLLDYDKTVWQGINGAIWALIALDCKISARTR